MRLTDQALVAVTIGRQRAAGRGEVATIVDLVVGLVVESDGAAGHVLRERSSAAASTALVDEPSGTAALDDALAEAASAAAPRPAATMDLLYAVLDVGGGQIAEVLADLGWEPGDLRCAPPGPAGETYGLRGEPWLSPGAAVAVARARARDGGLSDLLYELSAGPEGEALELALPEVEPEDAGWVGPEEAGWVGPEDAGWVGPEDAGGVDVGVDAVVDAARAFRPQGQTTTTDLLRAAIVVGGPRARRLLGAEDG